MQMDSKNSRLFTTVLSIAILCAAFTWGISKWKHSKEEEINDRRAAEQISSYLTAIYALYGDWSPIIEQLEFPQAEQHNAFLNGIGRNVRIWSVDNSILWEPLTAAHTPGFTEDHKKNRHILLQDRQVIGYFQLQHDDPATPWHVWFASIVTGTMVGVVMYGLLLMQASTHRRYQKKVLYQLTEMEQAPTSSHTPTKYDQLIEDKLSQISQRLYRLETVRKSMVADVAHELRTPLSIMRAQLDNALYNQASIEPSHAALLQAEVYRMSKLLGDLQQLALAESGHLQLNQAWLPLQSLLAAIVDAFAIDAEEKDIDLLLNCPPSFRVYADKDRLRQVFVNLIGNALRFARSKIEITVKLDNPYYVITVTDDGIGIEVEDLPYIFERFYSGVVKRREPASTSASGLGLGLPIVKQWIETHNGAVSVSSQWNAGTVFHIQLPVFYEQRLS